MKNINVVALSIVAAALVLAPPAVRSQAPPPETPKTGSLKVTVDPPAKGTVKQATLYAKTKVVPGVAAGKEILVEGVPVGKAAVTVDATVEDGGKKVRHLGVVEVTVVEGDTQAANVGLTAVPDVDVYCLGCHPNPRDPDVKVKPGQIVRDIHTSGREFPEKVREKHLAVNREYNAKVARLEKEGKPHSMPMPLEVRVVKVGGKEVKKYFYTCETCHTLHQATPWIRYARAGYRTSSDLCTGCHF